MLRLLILAVATAALIISACSPGQDEPIPTPTSKPSPLPTPTLTATASVETVGITLPPGFQIEVLIDNLRNPTSMAFGPGGRLYISQLNGDILVARDIDGDGLPDRIETFASGFNAPLGLAFLGDDLYVSSKGRVTIVGDIDGDGRGDIFNQIITGLPNGAHQNNGLAFGPDGKLYLTLGSTCNACIEGDPRSATIMRYDPDGSNEEIFARGLRNVYDIAFHPQDGTLFGMENGRDDKGLDVPEDLDVIVQGGNYGWPDCWGKGRGSNCQGTIPPIAELESRSSANGLLFYTAEQFPPEYRGDLFIAMWGSTVVEAGRKIVRVKLTRSEDSYEAEVIDFATGMVRPLDLVLAPDGSLLVADFSEGVIFRVVWKG